MSTRKFESESLKLKKNKIESLVKSQKGALDKFIITNKKGKFEEELNNIDELTM